MAGRMSIARIREYFRTVDIDEADVVLTLVSKDVAERHRAVSQPALPFHKKPRKQRVKKPGERIGIDVLMGETVRGAIERIKEQSDNPFTDEGL